MDKTNWEKLVKEAIVSGLIMWIIAIIAFLIIVYIASRIFWKAKHEIDEDVRLQKDTRDDAIKKLDALSIHEIEQLIEIKQKLIMASIVNNPINELDKLIEIKRKSNQ